MENVIQTEIQSNEIEDTTAIVAEIANKTSSDAPKRAPRVRKDGIKPAPRAKKTVSPASDMNEFKKWLIDLDTGVNPALHINGAAFTNCVLTVDFGTPLNPIKITPDQTSELVTRLRHATKLVMNREVKVGVMTDHSAGIWWTVVS